MTTDKNLHQAFSDPIFTAIGEIAEKMQTRAFAIGGCVRDALLRRKDTKDIDIDYDNSGYGVKTYATVEMASADSPTSCKMKRP